MRAPPAALRSVGLCTAARGALCARARARPPCLTLSAPHPLFPAAPRRFIDAMMVQRELKAASSEFAKRVAPEDAGRLVRDRLFLLKSCVIAGKDTPSEPFLYHLH